jgi:nucleoside-diphosphate-sugar epimerase
MIRIGVTGATGFVGTRLVSHLSVQGYQIKALSRKPGAQLQGVSWVVGDISQRPDSLSEFVAGVDVLFHCAAEIHDEDRMLDVNYYGTRNLVEAANGVIKHWVQLSTVDVYGTCRSGEIDESFPFKPVNIYESSKVEAEKLFIHNSERLQFSWSILRPSKIYGPSMRNQTLFRLISLIRKNLFFFIGKPGAVANYIHVDDVVTAMIMCGTMPEAKYECFNLSYSLTMEDFVGIISNELGKKRRYLRLPEGFVRLLAHIVCFFSNSPSTLRKIDGMTKRAVYSSLKIQQQLGFRPGVAMDQGLKELVRFWVSGR